MGEGGREQWKRGKKGGDSGRAGSKKGAVKKEKQEAVNGRAGFMKGTVEKGKAGKG